MDTTELLLMFSLIALIGIFIVLKNILGILLEWKIDWEDKNPDIEVNE